ncbi:hypothetical protein GCM10010376_08550 [Streptomyces violaceusniger]
MVGLQGYPPVVRTVCPRVCDATLVPGAPPPCPRRGSAPDPAPQAPEGLGGVRSAPTGDGDPSEAQTLPDPLLKRRRGWTWTPLPQAPEGRPGSGPIRPLGRQ